MKKTNEKVNDNDTKNSNISEEKQKLLVDIEKTKEIQDRVELFSKIMDTYGVDVVVSLLPELGDAWSSIISTLFFLHQWKKIWLSTGDTLKIIWYQTADVFVGAIPVLWDIADYFFKANKRSANIFKKHFEKLKKEAIKKWIPPETLEHIQQNNDRFIEILSENKTKHI